MSLYRTNSWRALMLAVIRRQRGTLGGGVPANSITTEDSNPITTEAGDMLVTET